MQTQRLSNTYVKRLLRFSAGAVLCTAFTVADLIDAGAAEQAANVATAAADPSPSTPSSGTRKVRVIDMTAANAASSDSSHWYNRVAKPGAVKSVAKAIAVPAKPGKTKKTVRRAPPREPDARSAYASAPEERQSFGLFRR